MSKQSVKPDLLRLALRRLTQRIESVAASSGTSCAASLIELLDVGIINFQVGDVLTWNGVTWANQAAIPNPIDWNYGTVTSVTGTNIDMRTVFIPLGATFNFGSAATPVSS